MWKEKLLPNESASIRWPEKPASWMSAGSEVSPVTRTELDVLSGATAVQLAILDP